MTRILMFKDGSVVDELDIVDIVDSDEARPVLPFISLDDCWRDIQTRGRCVKFDLHGLWWSVPVELTIREIDAQIRAGLERMACKAFPAHLGETYRPTVA